MTLIGKPLSQTIKSSLRINDNTGVDGTVERITDGQGTNTAGKISKDHIHVVPTENDSTSTFKVENKAGAEQFKIDTTNGYIKALEKHVNTQYINFYTQFNALTVNTHTALFLGAKGSANVAIGTGTDPDTTKAFATTADDFVTCFAYLPDNITVDSVTAFVSDSGATAATIRLHLMSYDIDTDNGAASGDLTNGTVVADGSDLTNVDYSAIDSQSLTIQSANVDAGKILVATIYATNTADKKSANITVKYHLR